MFSCCFSGGSAQTGAAYAAKETPESTGKGYVRGSVDADTASAKQGIQSSNNNTVGTTGGSDGPELSKTVSSVDGFGLATARKPEPKEPSAGQDKVMLMVSLLQELLSMTTEKAQVRGNCLLLLGLPAHYVYLGGHLANRGGRPKGTRGFPSLRSPRPNEPLVYSDTTLCYVNVHMVSTLSAYAALSAGEPHYGGHVPEAPCLLRLPDSDVHKWSVFPTFG